jgi:hypothetical protein
MPSQLKIQIDQVSASTSQATIGNHKVLIDRPTAKGGSDQGPMGRELFLAAVGGCSSDRVIGSSGHRIIENHHAKGSIVTQLQILHSARHWSLATCHCTSHRRPRLHYDEYAAREA